MSEKPPFRQVTIPESLQLQLVDFRRRLWRMKIVESVAAGLIGLLVSFLLVYGLDRIIATPSWVRLFILLAGVSLFTVFAPYWLHRWVWRRRKETQIAQLIAKHYPGGTSALITASLDIEAGEMVLVAGRSGAGRSTLLNLSGFDPPHTHARRRRAAPARPRAPPRTRYPYRHCFRKMWSLF